jgi:hypothetical protein
MDYATQSSHKQGGNDEKVHLSYSGFDDRVHADRLFGYERRAA